MVRKQDGALADRRRPGGTAGIRRRDRTAPPLAASANARRHLDFLRRGQGQRRQRNIVMNGVLHLPTTSASAWDLRGHWEGNTLCGRCDESPMPRPTTRYRYTCASDRALDAHGPDLTRIRRDHRDRPCGRGLVDRQAGVHRQSEEANRLYTEPRCIEEITAFRR